MEYLTNNVDDFLRENKVWGGKRDKNEKRDKQMKNGRLKNMGRSLMWIGMKYL